VTPLHAIGEFVRNLFLHVPMGAARALFLALPIALLLWVALRKPDGDEPPALSRRLKFWATVALAIQIAIYCLL
jgi:hypothetical protein